MLVAATAPLTFFYKGNMLRFTGLRPGYEEQWNLLIYALADHCKEANLSDPLLFASFDNWEFLKSKVEKLQAKLVDTHVLYCKK